MQPGSVSLESTIEDTLVMIVEQNISMYIQLAPSAPGRGQYPLSSMETLQREDEKAVCRPFLFDLVDFTSHAVKKAGISNFSHVPSRDESYYAAQFTVSADVCRSESGKLRILQFINRGASGMSTVMDGAGCDQTERKEHAVVNVEYAWFLNWSDFEPPPMKSLEVKTNSSIIIPQK